MADGRDENCVYLQFNAVKDGVDVEEEIKKDFGDIDDTISTLLFWEVHKKFYDFVDYLVAAKEEYMKEDEENGN